MGLELIVSPTVFAGRIWHFIEVHAQTGAGNLTPARGTAQPLVRYLGLGFDRYYGPPLCSFTFAHDECRTMLMIRLGGANSSQILSPCSSTTYGCSYSCSNKFKVELGVLQLTDTEKSQPSVGTTSAPFAGTTKTATVTSTSITEPPSSTQGVISASTPSVVCVSQPSVGITTALVGVTIGVPLAIGLIITALLLQREKNRNRHLHNTDAATKDPVRAGLVPPPPSPASRVQTQSSPHSIYLPIQSDQSPDQLSCYEMPDRNGQRLALEMLYKSDSHEMP